MQKLEAKFTARIEKWFAKTVLTSSPFEIKHTRGKPRFTLSELKEHQKDWLLACTSKTGCTYKMPDTGYGFNPFDCFHYKNADSYVVIVFPNWIVAIEIRVLLLVKEPSITEEKALKLAYLKILTSDI